MDPDLIQKEADLQREKHELRIREEKIRTDKQRQRLDAMEAGKEPVPGGVDPLWPLGRGVPFKVIEVRPNEFAPVPLDEDDFPEDSGGRFGRRGRFDRDREPRGLSFQEQMALQREQAAAAERLEMLRMMMQPREDSSVKILLAVLPLVTGNQAKLPELMAMVDTMTKGQQVAMKHALEMQGDIMGKVADHMLESGAPSDMIDQAKRIVEVATEGFGKVVKHTTGRESLLNPDKPKALPAAATRPAQAVARRPQPPPPPIDATPGAQPLPPPQQGALPSTPSPAEQARAVGVDRATAFLALHEREMLNGSDPAIFFEDEEDAARVITLVVGLPRPIRVAIEAGAPGPIYEAFKGFVPDVVARIFSAMEDPKEGAARKEFAEGFWSELAIELKGEPEPESEPDGDDVQGRRAAE